MKRKRLIWAVVILVVGMLLLLIGVGAMVWWQIRTAPAPAVLSGVNLYREPIVVSIQGNDYQLDTFDTYTHTTVGDQQITVAVVAADGSVLETRTHSIPNTTTVVMDYFSLDNQFSQCAIRADVTDLYYQTGESFSLQDYAVIVEQATNTFSYSENMPLSYIVYLGNYQMGNLPETVTDQRGITGLYPVNCNDLDDVSALQERIMWWVEYDSAEQRQLLKNELDFDTP